MGEKQAFQPLTQEDRITVLLYRCGIVLSALILSYIAILSVWSSAAGMELPAGKVNALGLGLEAAAGMSVFFIHLYIRAFKRYLIYLYIFSLVCFAGVFAIGNGSLLSGATLLPSGPLLLLPLAGCLGFVTAKEAFCFRIMEGYIIALLLPLFLIFAAAGIFSARAAAYGLSVIAGLLVIFTLRKVFMPIAWDIGDKSAYR